MDFDKASIQELQAEVCMILGRIKESEESKKDFTSAANETIKELKSRVDEALTLIDLKKRQALEKEARAF